MLQKKGLYRVCKYIFFSISFVLFANCQNRLRDSVGELMDEYPFIKSIDERRRWNGSGGDWIDPLALDIKMENDKRIFVSYIKSSQLKAPFILDLINTSTFMVRYECSFTDTYWARTGIPSDYLARAMGINLDSIDDVIENYEGITDFVNSLTKLGDIVTDGRTGFFYNKNNILSIKGDWLKKTKPLIFRENDYFEKLFILNIEGDKFPNFYTYQAIITKDRREYGRSIKP
jgi:hypothetical protein